MIDSFYFYNFKMFAVNYRTILKGLSYTIIIIAHFFSFHAEDIICCLLFDLVFMYEQMLVMNKYGFWLGRKGERGSSVVVSIARMVNRLIRRRWRVHGVGLVYVVSMKYESVVSRTHWERYGFVWIGNTTPEIWPHTYYSPHTNASIWYFVNGPACRDLMCRSSGGKFFEFVNSRSRTLDFH